MGNTEVKEEDPFAVATTKSLYPTQLDHLKGIYKEICNQETGAVTNVAFKGFLKLPEVLSTFADRLYKVISETTIVSEEEQTPSKHKKKAAAPKVIPTLFYKQLVHVLDIIYRGRPYQFAHLFFTMYAKDKNEMREEDLNNLLMDCVYISELNRYLYTKENLDKFEVDLGPYKKRIESIQKHIISIYEEYPISVDNLSNYLNNYLPSFGKAFEYLLWHRLLKTHEEDNDNLDFWPPYLLSSEICTVSDIDSVIWLLACCIELDISTWKVIYAVTNHGQSLNRLCNEVLEYGGPTILLIEDSEGGIFGCFTREPWKSRTDFREDPSAFLFSLGPHFGIYRSTGTESHNLFLNANSIPHLPHPVGIGFGGKLKSFRLWIHEELSSGEARSSCSTYARGKITSPIFKIKTLEVWGCGGAKAEELQQRARVAEEKEIEKRRKVKKDFVMETWDSGPSRYIMDLAGKTGVSEPFLEDFRKMKAMKEKQRAEEAEKLRRKKEEQG